MAMPGLRERATGCPYCGESISILVDESLPEQRYVEDCEVCCRPIVFAVTVSPDGDIEVMASNENE